VVVEVVYRLMDCVKEKGERREVLVRRSMPKGYEGDGDIEARGEVGNGSGIRP
jgi:hypothetical protein